MQQYKVLMAKTSPDTADMWLPLWMHLRDTAGVMRKLVSKWIPEAIIRASGMEFDQFMTTSVFLAAVHDIGKATSYFQNIITKSCPEKFDEISGNGFCVNHAYRDAGKTHHAYAGQWILQSDTNGFGIDERLASVVGSHHGKPDDSISFMGELDLIKVYPVNFFGSENDADAKKVWKDVWNEIVSQAMDISAIESVSELPILTLEAQVLISGLLITADWIASNTTYFPLVSIDEYGDENIYPKRVNEGWKKLAFSNSWYPEVNFMDKALFGYRFGFDPNDVQEHMLKIVNSCETPGLFVLEAQMGVGKTEAALGAAEVLASKKKAGGIFFGLPTQATSNGLFGRLYQWGERVSEDTANAIRLAHNAAEFHEDYNRVLLESKSYIENGEAAKNGIEVHPWFQGNKKALLADFVIGTVDQFLMASLRRRHFMLRHIGLAGKVVIIDEVHAYDEYMNKYLERSLQWMAAYGVPVILLSATLPPSRRKTLVECYAKAYSKYYLKKKKPELIQLKTDWHKSKAYPLITWTDGECINQEDIRQHALKKRVRVRRINSISYMIDLLGEKLADGGGACVIVNTVKTAQKIYKICTESMKGFRVILYHAQFMMPDRMKKEKALLEKMGKRSKDEDRRGVILIGTQVLEQSLDYDADIMVTQLCPVDLLLQRIGRLHRHIERVRPDKLQTAECIILHEDGEVYDSGSKAVYGDYLLMRTDKILADEIELPDGIPDLVQMVYDEENDLGIDSMEYADAVEKYRKDVQEKQQRAQNYLIMEPKPKKRIDDLLYNPEKSDEKLSEACVRDGESSIEVLLMKKSGDGGICFVDEGTLSAKNVIEAAYPPDAVQGRRIAMQRIKLPYVFSKIWNIGDTIKELEARNKNELAAWQQSPWLRGELVLLLDENNKTEFNGYLLSYSYDTGLEYEKKGENDE